MPCYYDDKTKKWYCKFYYQDYTGARKQKKKRGFDRKKDAAEWERSFLEKQQGTPDMTFQSLYDIYIEDMSHRLRASSIEGKKCVFKNRILPYFGSKPVNAITPKDIREWQNIQISQGFSDAYLDRIQNMIVTIFNYAVTYYNLPVNPCDKAGHMGKRTRSMSFWTLEEYRKAMEHITEPRARASIELLFFSGMRCGELLALTYDDLDFDNNIIHVTKSLHQKGSIINPPKTSNGVRDINIPIAVMNNLRTYTEKIYGISGSDFIFPFTRMLIRNHMQKAAKLSGVPQIRIHDLRHSHVSLLIDMGFSPHLIAERIGDTVQMVNNTYGHLYPTKHKEIAEKLNELL